MTTTSHSARVLQVAHSNFHDLIILIMLFDNGDVEQRYLLGYDDVCYINNVPKFQGVLLPA